MAYMNVRITRHLKEELAWVINKQLIAEEDSFEDNGPFGSVNC